MKLIKDLGMQEYGTQGRKQRYGIYECPKCGEHFRCATTHVKTRNTTKCRVCADKYSSAIKVKEASDTFIYKANSTHDSKYDYTLVDYRNVKTSIQIICPIHGVFFQTPKSHLQGKGCPSCANNGFDKTKSAVLYYIKISSNNVIAYKIGITNRTVKERFSATELEKIQVLKVWDFPLGSDALVKEQEILKLYKEFKYIGDPLLSSGNTELFTYDVLGLDYAAQGTSM